MDAELVFLTVEPLFLIAMLVDIPGYLLKVHGKGWGFSVGASALLLLLIGASEIVVFIRYANGEMSSRLSLVLFLGATVGITIAISLQRLLVTRASKVMNSRDVAIAKVQPVRRTIRTTMRRRRPAWARGRKGNSEE